MSKRIISGIIGGGALIAVLAYGDKQLINICIGLISFLALLEVYRAINLTKNLPLMISGFLTSFLFTYAQSLNNKLLFPIIMGYLFLLFAIHLAYYNKLKLQDIAKTFFATFYISFLLGTVVYTRKMEHGEYYIWLIFITAYMTDTAAYFVGKFLGKRKLSPVISPNKTVEGSIGGLIGSVLTCCLYGYIVSKISAAATPDYLLLSLLGIVGSIMSQFGDLTASAIKREYHIKDFGSVIPGHGGIVDRIDSVLFAAPTVFIFATMFPHLLF